MVTALLGLPPGGLLLPALSQWPARLWQCPLQCVAQRARPAHGAAMSSGCSCSSPAAERSACLCAAQGPARRTCEKGRTVLLHVSCIASATAAGLRLGSGGPRPAGPSQAHCRPLPGPLQAPPRPSALLLSAGLSTPSVPVPGSPGARAEVGLLLSVRPVEFLASLLSV